MEMTIGKIRPSPTNPRRAFNGIDELAESIKAQGILQELLVRPIAHDDYEVEIVFGERRFRAAKAAGLTSVSVQVRELGDKEAHELQMIENVQREDLTILEEADGYQALVDRHGYTVDQIVERTGKTRATIYARLKLASLTKDAREALESGRMVASTALLVARVPAALQGRALKLVARDGEPRSAREAMDVLQSKLMVRLREAKFDTSIDDLVPLVGSCFTCPSRVGNDRDSYPFTEIEDADVCTNPLCFGRKTDALYELRVDGARQAGYKIFDTEESELELPPYMGGRLRYDSKFVDLANPCEQDPDRKPWKRLLLKALKADTITVYVARTPDVQPLELVIRVDALAWLASIGVEWAKAPAKDSKPDAAKEKADREKAQRKAEIEALALRLAMEKLTEKAAGAASSAGLLRLVVIALLQSYDYGSETTLERRETTEEKLTERLVKMSEADLRGLVAELLATDNHFEKSRTWADVVLDLYKVPLDTYRSAAKAEIEAREVRNAPAAPAPGSKKKKAS